MVPFPSLKMIIFLFVLILVALTSHGLKIPEGRSKFYRWKNSFDIHYEQNGDTGPPLLLIPGFGVGTFHYERNIPFLAQSHRVFSIDLLGQGKSWPVDSITKDQNFCYSIESWHEQISYFIENIICEPVHVAGNSLGGLLSVATAFRKPELIKSICLMNAAPFWAFLPPKESQDNQSIRPPWDGTLPAPDWILKFGSSYFDSLRNPLTVKAMLTAVYSNPESFDDQLVNNIITSASHPGGPEAFTSILFSPKFSASFDEMIASIKCPLCLIYGKNDPWIVPYWGQRIKRIKKEAIYFEIEPAGHCPHHEVPNAVNSIIQSWISYANNPAATESNYAESHNTFFADIVREYEEMGGVSANVKQVDGAPQTFFEKVLSHFDNTK